MNAEARDTLSIQRLFLVTIILKLGSSLLGWWLERPWSLGFVLPLVFMGLYIVLGLRRGDHSVSDEKFADSCYYLGFIFTISSILVALLDLPSIATRLGDIAIRFGAAMVSTVLGLTVRVYLVNFRPEFQDGLRNAETGMLDAVRSFRMHLDLSVAKLNEFQVQVGDASRLAVAQSEVAIRDAAEVHARQFENLFERMSADYHRHFEDSTAHLKAATQTLATALYDYTQSLVNGTGKFESTADEWVKGLDARLRAAALPEDYFSSRLEPAVAGLGRAVTEAGGEVESLAGELRQNVGRISADLAGLGTRTAEAFAALDRVRDSADGQMELLTLAERQAEILHQLTETLGRMETTVGRSLASIGAMEQSVRQIVDEADKIAAFNREAGLLAQRQAEATAGLQREMAGWLARLQENDQRMVARIEEVSRAFDRSLARFGSVLEGPRDPQSGFAGVGEPDGGGTRLRQSSALAAKEG